MAVTRLEIANVRCVAAADLALDAASNLITGPNGAGKTTVLEAAHVLGRGHSFRVRDNRRLIRHGEAAFRVFGELSGARRRRVGVGYEHGTLDVRLDGTVGRRASELAQCLPIEVIDAGAHRLIDGGPAERRRFIDWALFHVEPGYVTLWRDFRRVLVQRNEGLRRQVSDRELDVWDEAFITAGERLDQVRRGFVGRWGAQAATLATRLLGAALSLDYRGGHGGSAENLREALVAGRQRDRSRGLTLAGPHRSDVAIGFGGGAAREVASRGQQKMLAIALILGRLADRVAGGGSGGLLLIDDPVAELDAQALGRLLAELRGLPVQTLVTAIEAAPLRDLAASRTFHVEHGIIAPVRGA